MRQTATFLLGGHPASASTRLSDRSVSSRQHATPTFCRGHLQLPQTRRDSAARWTSMLTATNLSHTVQTEASTIVNRCRDRPTPPHRYRGIRDEKTRRSRCCHGPADQHGGGLPQPYPA